MIWTLSTDFERLGRLGITPISISLAVCDAQAQVTRLHPQAKACGFDGIVLTAQLLYSSNHFII
ncbi:hypothetical protein J4G08_16125 [Candidatus Poribacteria bacterium]|nr:hypothetical protein [Candidatus Poribacteria bacterium]